MKKFFRSALVVTLLSLFLFASGCGGGGTGGTQIGPEGGTVTSTDGKVTLIFPENALSATYTINITPVAADALPASFQGLAGSVNYELTPDGLTFNVPVTVRISLTQEEAADFLIQTGLNGQVIVTDESGNTVYLDGVTTYIDQDSGNYVIEGTTTHFSYVVVTRGLVDMRITPAGAYSLIGFGEDIEVSVTGRQNINFGSLGNIGQVRILSMTLRPLAPDFITVTPGEVVAHYINSVTSINQKFTYTCNSEGSGFLSFYIMNPQQYDLAGADTDAEYTLDKQFAVSIPIVCGDIIAFDKDTSTDFGIMPSAASAAVGENATLETSVLLFNDPASMSLTATSADPTIAGPSPQTVNPYPYKKYKSSKQNVLFTCYKAGQTTLTWLLEVTDMSYWTEVGRETKSFNLTLSNQLTCTETVPAPTGCEADGSTVCHIYVGWDYTDSFMPTGFEIQRDVAGEPYEWVDLPPVTDGSARQFDNAGATDPDLHPGTMYCYRVRAYKTYTGIGTVYSEWCPIPACATKQ